MSAWTTMASNKIVTYADLANAISTGDLFKKNEFNFEPPNNAPKKSTIENIVFLDTSNSVFISHSANQLLPRSAIVGIPPTYNLTFTGFNDGLETLAGSNYTYSMSVTNSGSVATSSTVTFTLTLPAFTSFVSVNSPTSGVTFTSSISGQVLTINVTSFIAVSQQIFFNIPVSTSRPTVDGSGLQGIPLQRTYAGTSSILTTPYLKWAIFEVVKLAVQSDGSTPITSPIVFNTTFKYKLRVRSFTAYPLYPQNVTLTDVLPSNIEFVSFDSTTWTTNWNSSTRTVTFSKSGDLHASIFNTFESLFFNVKGSTANTTVNNTFTASATNANSKTSANLAITVAQNTTPTLTSQGYSTCSSCTTYTVFRDTNSFSATFNRYFVNNVNVGLTAPSNGACDYSSQYENTFQIFCTSCNSYFVFAHNYSAKPCFTGAPFQVNGVDYYYNPATGGCNTSPSWSASIGTFCSGCVEYVVQQNTNPCYTGNQFLSNGVTYSYNPTTGACNYSANYAFYVGQTCIDCTTYSVYQNVSSCFTGNQFRTSYNGGTTYASNPVSGACNTSPNIVSQGYFTCSSCVTYLVYRDVSTGCSPTKNNYFVNGVNVGATAPVGGVCFTGQNLVFQGYNTCISCNSYGVYLDENICSSTNGHYFANGTDLGTSPPSSASCACCIEYSVNNNTETEVYIEWLPCTAGSNTSLYLPYGSIIYFCANITGTLNTGALGAAEGGSCSYGGYTVFTT